MNRKLTIVGAAVEDVLALAARPLIEQFKALGHPVYTAGKDVKIEK